MKRMTKKTNNKNRGRALHKAVGLTDHVSRMMRVCSLQRKHVIKTAALHWDGLKKKKKREKL